MPNWRKLFSTPRKAALSIACAVVMLATVGACVAVYALGRSEAGPEPGPEAEQSAVIGGENAQNFAFADAGVDPAQATAVTVKYARWQGQFVYEVEFLAGDTQYAYKIGAYDGSVAHKETKTVKGPEDSAPVPELISLEEARGIALEDAGVSQEQAVFTLAELDEGGSVPVYKVRFFAGNTQYDYEINARTGAVYSKGTIVYVGQGGDASPPPSPPEDSSAPVETAPQPQVSAPPAPSSGIAPPSAPVSGVVQVGADEARDAALSHAGFSAGEVMLTKLKLGFEGGAPVYEVEFYKDGAKYSYEISGTTGEVTAYRQEARD